MLCWWEKCAVMQRGVSAVVEKLTTNDRFHVRGRAVELMVTITFKDPLSQYKVFAFVERYVNVNVLNLLFSIAKEKL